MLKSSIEWKVYLLRLVEIFKFLALIIVFFCPVANAGVNLTDAIKVIVNDNVILVSEFNRAIERSANKNHSFSYQMEREVLDSLINEKLIEQESERLGVIVTSKEVEIEFENIEKLENSGSLNEILERDGILLDDFKHNLKKQIMMEKLIKSQVYSKTVIDDGAIENYYNENIDSYREQLKHSLCKVSFMVRPRSTCEGKKDIFSGIIVFFKELESGLEFDSIAKKYNVSENWDIEYLGSFALDELSDTVRSIVENLSVGQCSPISETEYGFEFFYLKAISKAKVRPLEKVRNQIYDILMSKEVNFKFKIWLDEIKKRSTIRILR